VKISDYLESNVLFVVDRDIRNLEGKIADIEAAAENLFAERDKNKKRLTEARALREKLVNLIELTGTWLVEEEK
jgi:hypothetical protein